MAFLIANKFNNSFWSKTLSKVQERSKHEGYDLQPSFSKDQWRNIDSYV